MKFINIIRLLAIMLSILTFDAEAKMFRSCTPIKKGDFFTTGPYDYYTHKSTAAGIEAVHFNEEVASLQGGLTGDMELDIQYILGAFPNHPRALQSLADLAILQNQSKIGRMKYDVSCYFIRAEIYLPQDGVISAIFAYYLSRIGQKDLAKQEIVKAIEKSSDSARANYFVGLAYFYLDEHQQAKLYENKAKELGYTATGLGNLLSSPVKK